VAGDYCLGFLEEYLKFLKEDKRIDIRNIYQCGRFVILETSEGLKLLIERRKDNTVVIDEVDLTRDDVEALWVIAGHYLTLMHKRKGRRKRIRK